MGSWDLKYGLGESVAQDKAAVVAGAAKDKLAQAGLGGGGW